MLTQITIKNFTIIELWEIELDDHLSVVTGESGAGKSMLIDAIELGLGGRTDASCVRTDCERAEIILTLELGHASLAQQWLQENDYDTSNECIIRRIIQANGRSKISINGTPCTLNEVKTLAGMVFNIHGQHQNQALLNKVHQLSMLDHYANNESLLSEVATIVREWQHTNSMLNKLTNNTDNVQAQLDLLEYQVAELNELHLSENEYSELDNAQRTLANAEETLLTTARVLATMRGDDQPGVINLLHAAQNDLARINIDNTSITSTTEMINNALIQSEEAHNELSHFVDKLQADPGRLTEIEQRLTTLHDFARKHKVEPPELFNKHLQLQQELSALKNAGTDIEQLKNQRAQVELRFIKTCKKLTSTRQKAATRFSTEVTEKLQLLGMIGGVFKLAWHNNKDEKPHFHGLETCEFMVCANPGQPIGALSKVASGGEISRIALAIQVIASQKMSTPTLIFDEVDVGIGGNTAAVVGKILRELGRHAQVLCITHQPQVAVCGHHHLHVQKQTNKKSTSTTISKLNSEQTTLEIARMLGGMSITDKTMANAKELISAV